MAGIYDNGASFRSGGKLYVTDPNKVDNLNAEKLQDETPESFVKTSSAVHGASGISQSGNSLSMTGETIVLDTSSQIKIGNIIIKSSDNGNGILIGI